MIHFPLWSAKQEFLWNAAVHCHPLPTNGSAAEKQQNSNTEHNTTYSYPGGVTDPDFGTVFIETQL